MKNILYSLLLSLALFSCDKSYEKLTPSGQERNWLIIENEGTTPMEKLCYKIFIETGIPIYYNDTIGSEQRFSPVGGGYTYYEILQPFYNPGSGGVGSPTGAFRLVARDSIEDLLPLTQYIYDEILPTIPKNIYIPSILLTTKLFSPSDSMAHRGLNTIVVGETLLFEKEDGFEKRVYKGAMLRSIISGHLINKEGKWLEDNFYSLSIAVNPKAPKGIYSFGKLKVTVAKAWEKFVPTVTDPKLNALGFIRNDPKPPTTAERSWYTPTKDQDVNIFCEKLFAYTTQEIETEYAGHKVIMAKFDVMRGKLIELGFTFN